MDRKVKEIIIYVLIIIAILAIIIIGINGNKSNKESQSVNNVEESVMKVKPEGEPDEEFIQNLFNKNQNSIKEKDEYIKNKI